MEFVTTRSRCAGDLRFVPSFEHHGWARNTFSFTAWYRARTYEPCCHAAGLHPDEASPSKSKNSFSSLSLRGKGGIWGPRPCCHLVMSTLAITLPRPSLRVRTLLALLSGVLVLGSVW